MISRVIHTFKCTVLATLAKPLQDNCLKLWTMFNGMDSRARIQKSSTVFCSSGMQLHLTLSFSCFKIYALKIRSMDLKPSSMLNVLMMQQFVDHMPRFIWVEIFSRFPSLTIFKRHDHFMYKYNINGLLID